MNGYDVTGAPLEVRREILKLVVSRKPRRLDPLQRFDPGVGARDHRPGLPPAPGGHRLQTPGLPLPARPGPRLAQGQVLETRGVRHRRLHQAERQPLAFWCLVARLSRPRKKLIYAGRVGTGFNRKHARCVAPEADQARRNPGRRLQIFRARPARHETSRGSNRCLSPRSSSRTGPTSGCFDILIPGAPRGQAGQQGHPRRAHFAERGQSDGERPQGGDTANGVAKKKIFKRRPRATSPGGSCRPPTTNSRGVRLTHPDKVLYPDQGITKHDLAKYYTQVADWMLPHVVDRPLAIVRCPAGSGKPCFFQKHPGEGASRTLAAGEHLAGRRARISSGDR